MEGFMPAADQYQPPPKIIAADSGNDFWSISIR